MDFNVASEIKTLKKVLVHRPGLELANLTPRYLKEQLFDDIPWLAKAQEEHDAFVKVMIDHGVEVYYLVDLVKEILSDLEIKKKFINQFLDETNIRNKKLKNKLNEELFLLETNELISQTMAGLRKESFLHLKELAPFVFKRPYPFLSAPMPNLYFTRDGASFINNVVSLNKMHREVRQRETIYIDFLFDFHPLFKNVERVYDRRDLLSVEGGDILILTQKVLAIGVSQRTKLQAIKIMARRLFKLGLIETIIAVNLPKERSFMHLDTALTQIDEKHFVAHHLLMDKVKHFVINKNDNANLIKITRQHDYLNKTLSTYLNEKIIFIPCGGNDFIASDREQWNDGANTLALSPGKVITYARNPITNKLLKEHGFEVIALNSSELARGRGGPHCMSMPLIRK